MSFDTYTHSYLNDPAAELFSSDMVTRFSQEGENEFVIDNPCIIKRISIDTTVNVNLYQLPDDIVSIRRITWRGFKLDPIPQRNFREVFQSATQVGRPFWYVFNNVGLNKIQFFPTPNESLTSITTNLYGSEIPNRVIIEYFRAPDFSTAVMPLYFRRRLLKTYVLRCCFGIEGRGQNMKNLKYYRSKYDTLKKIYGELLNSLHNKPRKLVVNGISGSSYFPGYPVLPVNRFGYTVDTGE